MKTALQLAILTFVLFATTNCTQNKQSNHVVYDKRYKTQIEETHKEMRYFLSANFIPGGSIAVMKGGKLVYSAALGKASKDLDVPVERSTKFRIGQLSEIFTALMFIKMEGEGLVNSDSTIQSYYPEFPTKKYQVQLKHLRRHTSGIRENTFEEDNMVAVNLTMQRAIDRIKADSLLFMPTIDQMESTWNYNLLGVVMEKVSKKSYRELLKHYITDTLQLNNTCVDNFRIPVENRTNYFDKNMISQVVNATSLDLRYRAASVGLLSNAEDLAKLGNAIASSDYFTAADKEILYEKPKTYFGEPIVLTNGWMVLTDNKGVDVYGRIGTITGGSALIFMNPKENLVIACCSNLTDSLKDFPILKIAELFLNNEKTN